MNVLVLIASCLVEFMFFVFAIIIVRSGLRRPLNRAFFFFLIAFAAWTTLNYASNVVQIGYDALLPINRMLFVASSLALYFLANFVTTVTGRYRSVIVVVLATFIALLASLLASTPLVVQSVIINGSDIISVGVTFGPLAGWYFLAVLLLAAYSLASLTSGVRVHDRKIRASSKTLLLTIGVAIIAILITNVLLPVVFNRFDFSVLGLLFGALIIGGVGYAMVRHGLFDIRFAVVRSVTYSLVLVTLAGLYLIIALAFSALFGGDSSSPNQAVSGVIISVLLASVFQPIKHFFDKVTNRFFYRDNYNTGDLFARLNKTLTSTTDLRGLLERAANEIGRTLKSEQTFFFINTFDGHYMSAGTIHHKQLPKSDTIQLESVRNTAHGVIVASLLANNDPIRRLMASHRVELILPLIQGSERIGYLCLGEHLTSGYTTRDMKVLGTISDELIIAIQNALSVQEVKSLNETLQQRVDEATRELRASNAQLQRLDKAKDEFVGMASHQLRTPLTSVKGYISMVIEGDAGKITEAQKHLLDEAFTSSERMVHLINDFLNVSRLQTGKFMIDKRPINLAKVVEQELESLATTAASRNLTFVYKAPKDFPSLDLDEGKIRQVIMNFVDNALYYSPEHTTIMVKLASENGEVIFTVKDAGIGVPEAEQAQLFSKFYRASNARKQRPDGTGVGLFLAKKVIDAHEGKVIFESVEGQGSMFGFRLPLERLRSVDNTN
jgi:signal transduction histidine kinase